MTKRNWYKSSLAHECNTKISEIDVKGACFSPLFDAHALTLLFWGRTACCQPDEVMGFRGLCLEPGAENLEAGGGWDG